LRKQTTPRGKEFSAPERICHEKTKTRPEKPDRRDTHVSVVKRPGKFLLSGNKNGVSISSKKEMEGCDAHAEKRPRRKIRIEVGSNYIIKPFRQTRSPNLGGDVGRSERSEMSQGGGQTTGLQKKGKIIEKNKSSNRKNNGSILGVQPLGACS